MTKRPSHYKKDHRENLLKKINKIDSKVFSRRELSQSGSNKEQLRLNRALKAFVDEGHIIKITHGLYAKAMKIELPNGEVKTVLQDAFESVAMEALNKLGVKWKLGHAIQAYNRGETTQVPIVFSVQLHSRFRGAISAEGRTVVFEGGINAR